MKTKIFLQTISALTALLMVSACGGRGDHMPVVAGSNKQANNSVNNGTSPSKPGVAQVTFKDIKPIFEKNCTTCHAPGGALPNWLDYQVAFAKRDRLLNRVVEKRDMPMNAKLADQDIKLLSAWLQEGAPADQEEATPTPPVATPVPLPEPLPPVAAPTPSPEPQPPVVEPAPTPAPQPKVVTYEEVKPVFEKNCTMCHAPGGGLPNWLDYSTAYSLRERIYERAIVKKDMPMGMTLSVEDFNLLEAWLKGGAVADPASIARNKIDKMINLNLGAASVSDRKVSFQDVQPILEKRCVGCHIGLDMGSGPQNFAIYSLAFAMKQQIYDRVVTQKNMPLYSTMPQEERDLIRDWIDQGAQE